MASVYYLFEDALHTQENIVDKYKDHEYLAKKQHFAAVKIQSHYRGHLVRKEIKKLNRLATLIQKWVRGWILRFYLPDILHEYYDHMCINWYNEKATIIQALWRGYTVRKTCSMKDIKAKRERILRANEEMANALIEQGEKNNMKQQEGRGEKILELLFKRHHLLRTYLQEGVLSIHGSLELSELEKILNSNKWTDFIKKLRKMYNTYNKDKDHVCYMFDDKYLRKQEDLLRLKDKRSEIKEVIDFDKNIHDKPFFVKTVIDRGRYDPPITSLGKYSVVERNIVRTEDRSKFICDKDFNLSVLKEMATQSKVLPYYIDFWYETCKMHNLE